MFCKTFKKMFQLTLKFKKRVQGVKSLTTEVTMAVQVPSLPRYSGFKGSSIAEAPIQSLARECPYTMGAAIKKSAANLPGLTGTHPSACHHTCSLSRNVRFLCFYQTVWEPSCTCLALHSTLSLEPGRPHTAPGEAGVRCSSWQEPAFLWPVGP